MVEKGGEMKIESEKEIKSPLISLCENENLRLEYIKYIIEKGCEINQCITIHQCYQPRSYTLYDALNLVCKSEKIDLEVIKFLIENKIDVNFLNEKDKKKSIDYALLNEKCVDEEILKYLIENKCDPNWSPNNNPILKLLTRKEFPIHLVQVLVEYGSDIHFLDPYQSNLLHYICKSKNINFENFKYFIEKKIDINHTNKENFSPFLHLCRNEKISYPILKCAIENNANIEDTIYFDQLLQNKNVTVEMLKLFHCIENYTQNDQYSPYFVALKNKNISVEILEFLFQKNFSLNAKKFDSTSPILDYLNQKKCKLEIIEFLIEKKSDINIYDSNKDTCLHLAAFDPLKEKILPLLIKNKANVNALNNKKQTPLYNYISASNSNYNYFNFFVENKADLNVLNSDEITPFLFLIKNKSPPFETIKYLVENKADLSQGIYNQGFISFLYHFYYLLFYFIIQFFFTIF